MRSSSPLQPDLSGDNNRILRSSSRKAKQSLEPRVVVIQKSFSSEQDIFLDARRNITRAEVSTELIYLGIRPSWGSVVADSLSFGDDSGARVNFNSLSETLRVKIMPTEVHDCCQGWLIKAAFEWTRAGILSNHEFESFCFRVGTTIQNFVGPYGQSRKEPDTMIRPKNQDHPSIVVEAGWSESYPHLERDMRLWLDGTRQVNVVLVIKWSRSSSKVRGTVEAWSRGANGAPTKRQHSVIFPVHPSQPDIFITRGELLGSALPPNSNAQDVFTLTLLSLQDKARDALQRMGYQAA